MPYVDIINIINNPQCIESECNRKELLHKINLINKQKPHERNLKDFKTKACEDGETNLQRSIINQDATSLSDANDHTIEWLDIELPLVFSSHSRAPSLDLLGKVKDKETYVLCELKFTSKSSAALAEAIIQLCIYDIIIHQNRGNLQGKSIWHTNRKAEFDWNKVHSTTNSPILLVAANKKFLNNVRKSKAQIKRVNSTLGMLGPKIAKRLIIAEIDTNDSNTVPTTWKALDTSNFELHV